MLAAALGAPNALDASPRAALLAVAVSAVLLLALAVATGRTAPIPFAVLVLGALYVIPDGDRSPGAALYGAGLLLMAELAYWSIDERVALRIDRGALVARLLAILVVVAAAVPLAAFVLLVADADPTRSTGLIAAGAVAVVAWAALVTTLADR